MLGGVDDLLEGADRVLVNPSFAVSRNPGKAIANPMVLEASLAMLADRRVRDVVV